MAGIVEPGADVGRVGAGSHDAETPETATQGRTEPMTAATDASGPTASSVDTTGAGDGRPDPDPGTGGGVTGRQVLRWIGWTLVAAGLLVLLYLVYLLGFTNLRADAAQGSLRQQWEREVGRVDAAPPPRDPAPAQPPQQAPQQAPTDTGGAYAALWFERDGERIIHEDPLFVVRSVTLEDLRRGPGHYPESAAPGGAGNFAVAGHRTTYGAPFYHLDRLEAGDEVHVLDRGGGRHVYEVTDTRVVEPTDVWVVGDDPLEDGGAMLTLTTCNPRFSAAQRLVVFARLQSA